MTEYYVDAAAAGTGTGLTPANAFVSVLSVPWTNGDRAWVRRTHKEDMNAQYLGPSSLGAGTGQAWSLRNFSRDTFLIGWPDATGAYFDERPAAGVSASWDADNSTQPVKTTYGINVPTICSSGNSIRLGINVVIANMCIHNSLNVNAYGWTDVAWGNNDSQRCVFNNVVPLGGAGPMTNPAHAAAGGIAMSVEKMTIVATLNATTSYFDLRNNIHAKHLVIHQASQMGGILGGTNLLQEIGLLEIQSNSIAYLFLSGGTNAEVNGVAGRHVKRVVGIQPYSGAVNDFASNNNPQMSVDDYFGNGPMVTLGAFRDPKWAQVASGNATHFGFGGVMRYEVTSYNSAGNMNYRGSAGMKPILSIPVEVSSGIAVEIRVPIYVDATGVYSPAGFSMSGQLLAKGAKTVMGTGSTIIPGSASNWVGAMIGGGTPYLFTCVFTPTETGIVPFMVYPSPFYQANSAQPFTAFALFGQPYVEP